MTCVAAITLQCIECCGGARHEARRCEVRACFLWPHGPAARAARGEGEDGGEAENDGSSGQSIDSVHSPNRARWESLTPEERADRVARMQAGRKGL